MTDTAEVNRSGSQDAASGGESLSVPSTSLLDPAERPIELWPEGILAAVAGITLLVIGYRHRLFLQRKAQEAQRVVDEFQRQGGVDEIKTIARQAAEFLKG